MRFRPCIDLHEGRVKQIVGSTLNNANKELEVNYVSDKSPSWFAELYKKDSLFGAHVIMLGQGNNEAAKKALSSFKGGMQIGGGINPDNAFEYLNAGASHIIITSYVFKDGLINWDNLKNIVNTVGKDRLVLDLSCRLRNNDYYIVTDKWQKFTETAISRDNIEKLEKYCSEFLVHAVDVEGMMKGVDERLIGLLSSVCSVPVTYAGGIRSIKDLDIIMKKGNGTVDFTIGSALDIFGGRLSYKEVVKWNLMNINCKEQS